jgi:hypothetical protein
MGGMDRPRESIGPSVCAQVRLVFPLVFSNRPFWGVGPSACRSDSQVGQSVVLIRIVHT